MLALIDGDIVVHRVGYTTENEDVGIAQWRVNEMVEGILSETSADDFQIFLSDSTENGFRKEIYPSYKANRTSPKPRHYDVLKEYLVTSWDAAITVGQEADDALGIEQGRNVVKTHSDGTDSQFLSVICSIDKDLLQIPGWHYNFVKKEQKFVDYFEGMKFFYSQLLIGDVSDNVKGVWNVGEKKAAKLLQDCQTESQCFEAVVGAYRRWLEKEWTQDSKGKKIREWDEFLEHQLYNIILVTGRVLKIRQQEEELWNFPPEWATQQPILVSLSSSIQPMLEEPTQSTEPTGTD